MACVGFLANQSIRNATVLGPAILDALPQGKCPVVVEHDPPTTLIQPKVLVTDVVVTFTSLQMEFSKVWPSGQMLSSGVEDSLLTIDQVG